MFFLKKKKKTEPVGGKLCLQQYVQIFLKSTSFVFFVDCFFSLVFLGKNASRLVCSSFFFYSTCPMQHWEGGRKKSFAPLLLPISQFSIFSNLVFLGKVRERVFFHVLLYAFVSRSFFFFGGGG